jgi:hypothetical protein
LAPLRDCLRSLVQTGYVTLPLKLVHATTGHHLGAFYLKNANYHACGSLTALTALDRLVDLISEDHEMEELIWSPIAPYDRKTTAQAMNDFEKRLEQWQATYMHLIPELDSSSALNALLVYRWSTFTMPPPPYTSTTRYKSLAAAHYNFYKARVKWALLLLEEDKQQNKLTAEFYFYEALRHAASHVSFLKAGADGDRDQEDSHYIPCEALRVGLLPVLHIAGLCSPEPRWLEWIKDLSDKIVQEGVLKGHTFATNLTCLHTFETIRHRRRHRQTRGSGANYSSSSSSSPTSSSLERYPEPAERIICQLIPEADGRHFTSFFATPEFSGDVENGDVAGHDGWHQNGLNTYRVIGDARWRCGYGEGPCTPIYNMYDDGGGGDDDIAMLQPFSADWLYSTQPALKWLSWSQEKEFCMERALQDHINGTRLLLAS